MTYRSGVGSTRNGGNGAYRSRTVDEGLGPSNRGAAAPFAWTRWRSDGDSTYRLPGSKARRAGARAGQVSRRGGRDTGNKPGNKLSATQEHSGAGFEPNHAETRRMCRDWCGWLRARPPGRKVQILSPRFRKDLVIRGFRRSMAFLVDVLFWVWGRASFK